MIASRLPGLLLHYATVADKAKLSEKRDKEWIEVETVAVVDGLLVYPNLAQFTLKVSDGVGLMPSFPWN